MDEKNLSISCKDYIEKYLRYLSHEFTVEKTDRGCIIYTPFIGYNGDPYYVYVEDLGGGNIRLTDAGDTFSYLEAFDLELKGKVEGIFRDIREIYDIKEQSKELYKDTSVDRFGADLNLFISAVQAVSHLEYEKQPSRESKFRQKVHEYCDITDIKHRYLHEIKIVGKHTIDIVSMDEKTLIQTIGTVVKSPGYIKRQTEVKLFAFLELKIKNIEDYYRVSIYDDVVKTDNDSMNFIESYCDDSMPWTERKRLSDILTC